MIFFDCTKLMMERDATAGKLKPREFKSVLECELICLVFHSGGRTPNSRNLNKGKVYFE